MDHAVVQDRFGKHSSPADTTQIINFTVQERDTRSFLTRTLNIALRPLRPRLVTPKALPEGATRLTATKRSRRYCEVTERRVEGVWTYELERKPCFQTQSTSHSGTRRLIIYFAGGGWQMPPSEHHWALCAELVRRLHDTRVVIVSCPLAPAAPVSIAFPQIGRVYKVLLAEASKAGQKVIVAGDSSGGNIALCITTWELRLPKPEAIKPPVAIMVISPTTDLRHELREIKEAERYDPLHTHRSINQSARAWCPFPLDAEHSDYDKGQAQGDWSFLDPRVSPIQADLSCLVKHNISVHGIIGSCDVLEPEAIVFKNKCQKDGVSGQWLSWQGQMHCFPLLFQYGLREGKEGVNWMVDVLDKHR